MQPRIVPYSGRAEWFRILWLIAVLTAIVFGTLALTIALLYSTAIHQQGERLLEVAQSQARTIEAIARHETYHQAPGTGDAPNFLDVLVDAHTQYRGFGQTGEFTLAKLENDQIVFLLSHRHYDLDVPEPIPLNAHWAEPMRRALRGETGTVIGLDYRGATVLAAYEPVHEAGLGIVAKIDLAEIRAPYVAAVLRILAPALVAVFLGALLFTRITRPIVRRVAEGQQLYQELVETMHDGLAIQDEHGILQYVNEQYCAILNRPREELIGSSTDQFMTPESKARFAQQMPQRREGIATSYEVSFALPDGSKVDTLVSPKSIVDRRGVYRGSFATISQITHLKEIELALRAEKEQAQRYLDIAGVMLVVVDTQERIVLINKKGLEILGYDSDHALLGQNWFETCIPADYRKTVQDVFQQNMADDIQSVEHFENAVLTHDGSTRIIAWHNTVLRDNAGVPTGTLSSGEDVTEQRHAEQDRLIMEGHLRQGQKLESIGTLASGVAHEINNPLTGIINYAQLIHDRIEDAKLKEFARGIIEEGNRVATIVRSLLSFSRQENEHHSPASMVDLIDATLNLIGTNLRKDQIELIVDVAPDLPLLKCRSQQIQQVLLNLLTNARDALNDRYPEFNQDKIVRITVRLVEKGAGSWIRTVIEDHGTGIPSDIAERIFDPFFSTKPREKGTGLGLSISYGLVRDHHGELFVESAPNATTRFIMDLPVENGWSVSTYEASHEGEANGTSSDCR